MAVEARSRNRYLEAGPGCWRAQRRQTKMRRRPPSAKTAPRVIHRGTDRERKRERDGNDAVDDYRLVVGELQIERGS